MKQLISSIRIAFRALRMNKLRSALTKLGIVIGVASVIATVAIGSGATQRIQQQIASIGSNIIIVIPGSMSSSGVRLGTGNAVTLSEADARELVAQCPDVALASPMVRGGAQVVNGNNNWATSILGITPDYLTIRELTVAEGSEFAQQDVDLSRQRSRVRAPSSPPYIPKHLLGMGGNQGGCKRTQIRALFVSFWLIMLSPEIRRILVASPSSIWRRNRTSTCREDK